MYDSFRVSKLFSKLNVSQKQTKTQSITFIKGRTVYNKLKLIRKLVIEVVLKELTNHSWCTKGLLSLCFDLAFHSYCV